MYDGSKGHTCQHDPALWCVALPHTVRFVSAGLEILDGHLSHTRHGAASRQTAMQQQHIIVWCVNSIDMQQHPALEMVHSEICISSPVSCAQSWRGSPDTWLPPAPARPTEVLLTLKQRLPCISSPRPANTHHHGVCAGVQQT